MPRPATPTATNEAAIAMRAPRCDFADAGGTGGPLPPGFGAQAPPGGGGGGIQLDPAPPALLAGADGQGAPPLPASAAGAGGQVAPLLSAGFAGVEGTQLPPPSKGTHPDCC